MAVAVAVAVAVQPKPLLAPAAWALFFIAGHGVQIARILMDKQSVHMTQQQSQLYEAAFLPHGYSPRQFVVLWGEAKATWTHVGAGDTIVQQDESIDRIGFKLSGAHEVIREKRTRKTDSSGLRAVLCCDCDCDYACACACACAPARLRLCPRLRLRLRLRLCLCLCL